MRDPKPWHMAPTCDDCCGPITPADDLPRGNRPGHMRCCACGRDWLDDDLSVITRAWWSAGAYEGRLETEAEGRQRERDRDRGVAALQARVRELQDRYEPERAGHGTREPRPPYAELVAALDRVRAVRDSMQPGGDYGGRQVFAMLDAALGDVTERSAGAAVSQNGAADG